MSDDNTERCGYLLDDGSGCDNPTTDDGESGRCWLDGHNTEPMSEASQPGRPTKFTDERAQDVIEAARLGKSKAGCARAAGVNQTTLMNWVQRNPTYTDATGTEREFLEGFARARAKGENELIKGGLGMGEKDYDSSMAKFLLKTSFDYREVQEIRMDDDADIPEADERAKQDIDALVDAEPET